LRKSLGRIVTCAVLLGLIAAFAGRAVASDLMRTAVYGPFTLGPVELRVEADLFRRDGRDLAAAVRVLEASGNVAYTERFDKVPGGGVSLIPFLWQAGGILSLVLDAEEFSTPSGNRRSLVFLLWESDFCPVGRRRSAPKVETGRVTLAARLDLRPGTVLERQPDAPPDTVRSDRVTVVTWEESGRLMLKLPFKIRLCAPVDSRFTLVEERDASSDLLVVSAAPFDLDPAARGPAVIFYRGPTGAEGELVPLTPATEIVIGRVFLDKPPLEREADTYRPLGRYARVQVSLDGRSGFVAADDASLLGVLPPH
jgi:hypothetical protein